MERQVEEIQGVKKGMPMKLLDDICRCHDKQCPRRWNCARWRKNADGGDRVVHAGTCLYGGQSYYECASFIEDKEDYEE